MSGLQTSAQSKTDSSKYDSHIKTVQLDTLQVLAGRSRIITSYVCVTGGSYYVGTPLKKRKLNAWQRFWQKIFPQKKSEQV